LGFKLKKEGRKVSRSRAAAGLVLLVLLAHGFVVSSTHFHRAAPDGHSADSGTFLTRSGDAQDAPLAGKHAQCVLCRLQRNFVSDLGQSNGADAAPPSAPLVFKSSPESSDIGSRFAADSGRAPPRA
jgi:hypothetical protein